MYFLNKRNAKSEAGPHKSAVLAKRRYNRHGALFYTENREHGDRLYRFFETPNRRERLGWQGP